MGSNSGNNPATIDSILVFLLGVGWSNDTRFLRWPPDVFAVAAVLLQKSGAYINVIEKWPVSKHRNWANLITTISRDWKAASTNPKRKCPQQVLDWWIVIITHSNLAIDEIVDNKPVWLSLIGLCCAADSVCEGVGFLGEKVWTDAFLLKTVNRLWKCMYDHQPSTLCKNIHHSKVVVLPKVHTPQKGITLRSISHNLALSESADIDINWRLATPLINRDSSTDHSAVILIIPHPRELRPSQFKVSKPIHGFLNEMEKKEFGFFDYVPTSDSLILNKLDDLYRKTKAKVGRVDGIVFPEMALTPKEYKTLRNRIRKKYPSIWFLCCGVFLPPTSKKRGLNYAAIWKRFELGDFDSNQHKHHRWFLDESQICQYGMGSVLDPTKKWWENISIKTRELNFVAFKSWLTVCVLICEDLARPDPVGNAIRSVGPNLVIALLQDGPQLSNRWAARCATTLTDDPGCSVLTVTSLGMTGLSRPHLDSVGHVPPSRVIAHWKDRETGSKQISLPDNMGAVALCISRKLEHEWSADGRRSDRAALVKLAGVHYV